MELHAVCQETMIVNIEGESRLEKKNIELSALRNEYVTLMSSEGGLKEVQKYRKYYYQWVCHSDRPAVPVHTLHGFRLKF